MADFYCEIHVVVHVGVEVHIVHVEEVHVVTIFVNEVVLLLLLLL